MGNSNPNRMARLKRKKRISKKVRGTEMRPRLTVFRSSKHLYAQVIDDTKGITLAAASSLEKSLRENSEFFGPEKAKGKIPVAEAVGKIIGARALEKGIEKVVFDRNGFMYHGRVKALSDGAREAGLKF